MKQHYAKIILFCLCCLVGAKASAYDFVVDGIYYNLNLDGISVSVTNGIKYTGEVTIPESVIYDKKTYIVTRIDYNAFNDCSGLTSVTIPNSVTSIGSSAFYGCGGLTSVTIPNSVTSISDHAFYGCSGLTSVTIPNSVTSIGYQAFDDCSSLTSIKVEESNKTYDSRDNCNAIIKTKSNELLVGCMNTIIPNSVTSIGNEAFFRCSGLTSVTIPNSVTSIGKEAFYGCSSLTSVTIPNSVTSIGEGAFYGCSGLTTIKVDEANPIYDSRDNCNAIIETKTNKLVIGCKNTVIPNSVTSISDHAFYGCSGLTSVTIPNSVTSIDYYAFSYCSGLTSIKVEEGNKTYDSRDNCNAIIKTKTNELLVGCMNTIIPNSVTSIGNEAFFRCSGLTSVTIPNSVTRIGNEAFSGCSSLTSVTIPNSVTSIGYNAFYGCSSLTSVTIPNNVTSIGEGAFYGCSGLTTIKVDEANPIYDSRDNCNAIIETKTNKLVIGCKNTVIPNSVTSIGYLAFYGCSGLTSVTIPNSVTSIDYGAFAGCSSLTSVTIGNSVTSIGDSAFSGCSNIKIVTINSNAITSKTYSSSSTLKNIFGTKVEEYVLGDDVTSIGDYAFDGCSGLKSVTIPNSVMSIGDKAFGSKVKEYVNRGTTSLLALWKAGYTPYEMGKYITLPPTKLTLLSSTQTTLTMKVDNIYDEYKYLVGDTPLQGDIIELKNLCPNTGYESSIVVSNSIINYVYRTSFSTKELNPKVNFTSTASSITFNGTFDEGDATIKTYVLEANGKRIEVDGKNISSKGKSFTITGLDPQTTYKGKLTLTVSYGEGNKNTMSFEASSEGKTQQLKFSTLQPKVISVGNVIVAAEANLDEEETNAGFEWRRTDWTDDFASNTGGAYIYEGTMEGYIRNLNTEKMWKVRPYYESNSGKRYYGEWMGLDPTNTSYFEPTVHTYAKIDVQNNTASVKGYAMRGSDNVASQGFKYWKSAAGARAQGGSKVSVPADAKTVEASGQVMTAELTGLDYESSYSYVAFMTTTEGQTFYGEVQSFQTGVGTSGIDSPTTAEEAYEVARYDVKGRRISTPQRGLNILRLSDGSVRKVMVK